MTETPDRIFLVGMPGCGKSTLARALSDSGAAGMLDVDTLVEEASGRSVADMISSGGEAEFRRREAEALRVAASASAGGRPLVISTGGGAPCFGDNMDRMLAAGTVVWLQASTERTLERLAAAPGQRPAADAAMASMRLREWYCALLARRTPFYARAHALFDTTELDDAAAVAAAVAAFRSRFGF